MRLPLAYSTSYTTVYLFTDAQAVKFLLSTIPSVTFLRLSDASVICLVTYVQFPIRRYCIGLSGAPGVGTHVDTTAYVF